MHTHKHNHYTALWTLSGTTWVSRYQKKHSPTHTYRGHQSSLICFHHLLRSMASSPFNLRTLQSFSTISLQVFFGLPHGLTPLTSYSIHFFTQSLSSIRSTCPYHCNLFCCAEVMSSNPSLSQPFTWNSIMYLMPHIHLTILISAHWNVTTLSQINTNKSKHSEMGPEWQNPIQRTVRTAHLRVLRNNNKNKNKKNKNKKNNKNNNNNIDKVKLWNIADEWNLHLQQQFGTQDAVN